MLGYDVYGVLLLVFCNYFSKVWYSYWLLRWVLLLDFASISVSGYSSVGKIKRSKMCGILGPHMQRNYCWFLGALTHAHGKEQDHKRTATYRLIAFRIGRKLAEYCRPSHFTARWNMISLSFLRLLIAVKRISVTEPRTPNSLLPTWFAFPYFNWLCASTMKAESYIT